MNILPTKVYDYFRRRWVEFDMDRLSNCSLLFLFPLLGAFRTGCRLSPLSIILLMGAGSSAARECRKTS